MYIYIYIYIVVARRVAGFSANMFSCYDVPLDDFWCVPLLGAIPPLTSKVLTRDWAQHMQDLRRETDPRFWSL